MNTHAVYARALSPRYETSEEMTTWINNVNRVKTVYERNQLKLLYHPYPIRNRTHLAWVLIVVVGWYGSMADAQEAALRTTLGDELGAEFIQADGIARGPDTETRVERDMAFVRSRFPI